MNVTGNTTINGALGAGAITATTLSTTDNATVGGDLGVTGQTTTNGIANNGAISTTTLGVSGNATVDGTLKAGDTSGLGSPWSSITA